MARTHGGILSISTMQNKNNNTYHIIHFPTPFLGVYYYYHIWRQAFGAKLGNWEVQPSKHFRELIHPTITFLSSHILQPSPPEGNGISFSERALHTNGQWTGKKGVFFPPPDLIENIELRGKR